jgi:hypothetical protein
MFIKMRNGDKIQKNGHLDDKYLDKIKNIQFEPVFIMGLHRSGTTILYKMLAETGKFNILTAYHVIFYDELLYNHINGIEEKKKEEFNNLLIEKGIITRKTDNVKVSADYAHEYLYIFTERGYPWTIATENKEFFEEMCKKFKFISENNNPILLKNPYDYSNFIFIKKAFPNAKFIFINRNPLEVISSTMRLWRTHFSSKNEFLAMYYKQYERIYDNPVSRFIFKKYYLSKFPPGIFEPIRRSAKGTDYYLKNIKSLSEKDYISITYEKLCADPNKSIGQILDFLNLKTNIDFSKHIKPRKLKLTPEVDFMKNFIFKKMKPYFEYFNYGVP